MRTSASSGSERSRAQRSPQYLLGSEPTYREPLVRPGTPHHMKCALDASLVTSSRRRRHSSRRLSATSLYAASTSAPRPAASSVCFASCCSEGTCVRTAGWASAGGAGVGAGDAAVAAATDGLRGGLRDADASTVPSGRTSVLTFSAPAASWLAFAPPAALTISAMLLLLLAGTPCATGATPCATCGTPSTGPSPSGFGASACGGGGWLIAWSQNTRPSPSERRGYLHDARRASEAVGGEGGWARGGSSWGIPAYARRSQEEPGRVEIDPTARSRKAERAVRVRSREFRVHCRT